MTLLIGSLTIGLILSLLALGVYISFRIFHFPDITTDGSIAFGAAVSSFLLIKGVMPAAATCAGFAAGAIAGFVTGVLHTKFKINGLLAGILVMTALYSVNLHVMGKSNIPLLQERTLSTQIEETAVRLLGGKEPLNVGGWEVSVHDGALLGASFGAIVLVALCLYFFFRTNLGTAMRATGDNEQMIKALGVSVDRMVIVGLALANGLIGLSGALLAQYQGFADVQMGIGMVVWGLASVIIGEALVGTTSLGLTIVGTIMGSILFRLLVAIALRFGLNPNDLKLITAIFVFIALVLPQVAAAGKRRVLGVFQSRAAAS